MIDNESLTHLTVECDLQSENISLRKVSVSENSETKHIKANTEETWQKTAKIGNFFAQKRENNYKICIYFV